MNSNDKLLRIEAPHFVAGALWTRKGRAGWICYETAPILRWMVGRDAAWTKEYLKQKGWGYQWL